MKILVHLHLYYRAMWPEFRELLHNLDGYDYDLVVTLPAQNRDLTGDIEASFPMVRIMVVENIGYDVWPFIKVLNSIELDKYDYVLKVHTKNTKGDAVYIDKNFMNRYWWHNLLISALIGSKEIVKTNFEHLAADDDLGMIGSKYLITGSPANLAQVFDEVQQYLAGLGFRDVMPVFVAGTMFLVRAELLRPFWRKYQEKDFESSERTGRDGGLAHVLERLFGCYVIAKGLKIKGFDTRKDYERMVWPLRLMRFCFQRKVTKTNKLVIKFFKIPVYIKKLEHADKIQ